MIRCGIKEIIITPLLGLSIPGYFEDRKAEGIKDELYAKAIVLDDGIQIIAIVSIDAIFIKRSDALKIRNLISDSTGIPWRNIMVSATHTHTGPPTGNAFQCMLDPIYMDFLVKKAADVAVMAFRNRKSAHIGFGIGEESSIIFNRRYFMKDGSLVTNPGIQNPLIEKAEGPVDPDVAVVRIDDEEGQPIGVIVNYACHLDTVGGLEYCQDYPGEIDRVLKKVLGDNVISIFLLGACGNINHIDVSGKLELTPEHYIKMGRILAGEVIKTRGKADLSTDIKLGADSVIYMEETRCPSEADLKMAKSVLKLSGEDPIENAYAWEIIKMHESSDRSIELEIQVIKIGDCVITGLPGEMFVEFGLDIKKNSPFRYNIINTLVNGIVGYVPTREAFNQGGYEPRLARSSKLVPEAGDKIVLNAAKIINNLYEKA